MAYGTKALANITNYGTIENTSTADPTVVIVSGGTVTNKGLITSPETGVSFSDAAGSVVNFGSIVSTATGTVGAGVALHAGGQVTNEAGGTITAYRSAISAQTIPAAVFNYGSIRNTGSHSAIYLGAGGSMTNGSASATKATITSNVRTGIAVENGAGTVVNFGSIVSNAPLSGAAGSGIYLQLGGTITNEAGGLIEALRNGLALGGTVATSAAALITNSGTITGNVGVAVASPDSGANTIVDFGTIAGTGGTAVLFGGGRDTLVVEPGSALTGSLSGFAVGDEIDFAEKTGNGTKFANGVLSLTENETAVATIALSGALASSEFAVSADGHGGTAVTIAPPPSELSFAVAADHGRRATPSRWRGRARPETQ